MTARTRRRWQSEEMLAVIKEIQEKGSVVETCRKWCAVENEQPRVEVSIW